MYIKLQIYHIREHFYTFQRCLPEDGDFALGDFM